MLVFLLEAYEEEQDKEGVRTILRFHPRLAPVKAAVLPLVKRDEQLVALAQRVYGDLRAELPAQYDETGSVGRRYRRQDEIGTPWCLTVDSQSLEDGTVTIRDRDTMTQERIPADGVTGEIQRRLRAPWQRPGVAPG
jgi:glycyl-tRNA synthetase